LPRHAILFSSRGDDAGVIRDQIMLLPAHPRASVYATRSAAASWPRRRMTPRAATARPGRAWPTHSSGLHDRSARGQSVQPPMPAELISTT
jgi:hypothetical protein